MRIASFFKALVVAAAASTVVSCTSGDSDETAANPFGDIEWPDSLIPTGADVGSTLAFSDLSNFPTIYPPTYYDSGPGEVVLTFDGSIDGGAVTAQGLPVLSEDNNVEFDSDQRRSTSNWVRPNASGLTLGPFNLVFSLRGINALPESIDRTYRFSEVTLRFTSLQTEGDNIIYRGVFASGEFTMTVGPSYGDANLAGNEEDGIRETLLASYPFVFTVPIAPAGDPEEEGEGEP